MNGAIQLVGNQTETGRNALISIREELIEYLIQYQIN